MRLNYVIWWGENRQVFSVRYSVGIRKCRRKRDRPQITWRLPMHRSPQAPVIQSLELSWGQLGKTARSKHRWRRLVNDLIIIIIIICDFVDWHHIVSMLAVATRRPERSSTSRYLPNSLTIVTQDHFTLTTIILPASMTRSVHQVN